MKTPRAIDAVIAFIVQLVLGVVVLAQSNGFTLQVASVPTEAEAQAMTKRLQAKGLESRWSKVELEGKGTRYRIYIGHFTSREAARQQAEQARSQGLIKEFLLVPEQAASKAAANRETKPLVPKPLVPKPRPVEPKTNQVDKPSTLPADVAANTTASARLEKAADKTATANEAPVTETGVGKIKEVSSSRTKKAEEPPATVPEKKTPTDAMPQQRNSELQNVADKVQPLAPHLKESPAASALTTASLETEATPAADPLTVVKIENPKWEVVRRSSAADKNLRAVYFVDSLTGWAAGDAGTLYRTTDGGKTWKPLVSNTSVNIKRLHFVDWNTGWMLGEALDKDGKTAQTVLLSTSNGGRAWKRQSLTDVLGVYFIDAKMGWAVGQNGQLLKTSNGGATWQNYDGLEKLIGLPLESGTYNFGFCDVQFIDAEHGWVIGNFYGRAKNHLGGLFMTSDGGATWKRVPLTVQTQHSSDRFTPGLLQTVHFSDAAHGVITGEMEDGETRYFFVLQTSNGGKTWQQQRALQSGLNHAQFINSAQGWAALAVPRRDENGEVFYDSTLKRTENSGGDWLNEVVARGNQIRGLFFLSATKGWAVGERGLILRYEEGRK